MKNNIKIITGKLTNQEKEIAENSVEIIGTNDFLDEYNTMPYFELKKFYFNDTFLGYAVIFYGYHGLESSDVSLENVVWWSENHEAFIKSLELLKNDTNYRMKVDQICFDSTKFPEMLEKYLGRLGFKSMTRSR